MAWWNYPVTQGYGQNGEQGVDLGTPLHTPITNLYSGKVVETQYGAAGGIVGVLVNVPGLGAVVEYFLHLDRIDVKVGQQLGVGDQVGLSGGELAGTPGGMHPASPQFSTGPHTEFGFFRGTPFASADAGNPLPYLHPGTGGAPVASTNNTSTSAASGGLNQALCDIPLIGGLLCFGENAGQDVVQGITVSVERIGFFVLAIVLVIMGFILVAYQPAQEAVKTGVKAAVSGAEVA